MLPVALGVLVALLTLFSRKERLALGHDPLERQHPEAAQLGYRVGPLPALEGYFALFWGEIAFVSVLRPALGTHYNCQCSVISLHCVSCLAASTVPELFPKPVKLRPSGSQNAQQVIQNKPSCASGDLLEARRFQDLEKVSAPDAF